LAATLAVVVLLAAAGLTYLLWPRPVYVTDGSHRFSDDLRGIENLIQQENSRVQNGGTYVSIAFAGPMVPREDVDGLGPDAVRHDLEGAYLAQRWWNQSGNKPAVRLLLANEGNQEADWSPVARELEGMVDSSDHLVAVTGLGRSTDNTRNFVHELSANKIAIVAAGITGDNMTTDLDGRGPVRGMVRVAPTNSDEAAAAVRYLDNNPKFPSGSTVLMVRDQTLGDDYITTLGTSFAAALSGDKKFVIAPPISFDSSLGPAGKTLANDANQVCSEKADIVYFAGSADDLQGFLVGLAARSCASGSDARALTVVTGAGFGRAEGHTLWLSGAGANMTVLFTGLAHPNMWQRDPTAASQEIVARFRDNCETCFPTLFPRESKGALDDGDAIVSYDAVWTAETATQQATGSTRGVILPPATAVAQELNLLTRLPMASGWICSFDAQHNPVNKAIPILAMDHSGNVSYGGLSSSSGQPPTNGCPS
jgi:hypothetical protein